MLFCQVYISPLVPFFHRCFFLSIKAGSLLCYLSWQDVHLWFYILCVSCTWHSLTNPSGFASVSLRKGLAGSREVSFPIIPQPQLVTILQVLVIRKEGMCCMFKLFSYKTVFLSSLFSSAFYPNKKSITSVRDLPGMLHCQVVGSLQLYWSQRNDFQATYVLMARLFIRSVLQNNVLA